MLNDRVPLVSVIIPVYNAEPFLGKTIQSVIVQTILDIEILVVDDGSTDRSGALIDHLMVCDSRIKKIVQKNRGVSAARNLGFQHSKGEYIAFLDADDVWLPNNLEVKLEKFRNTDFGLIHSPALIIDEFGNNSGKIMTGREGHLLNNLLSWRETQVPGPSSILVKREVLEKVGLFDETLSTSADQDFFIRIAANYKIGCTNEPVWLYRMHANNMHRNIELMESDVLTVFRKAKSARMFASKSFQRQCLVNMYLILAASWAGDGKNIFRAIILVCRAFLVHPLFFLTSVWRRIFR